MACLEIGRHLASDVTGKGHTTKGIGAVRLLFAPLPEGFDIDRWSMPQ
ncbi:MAG: hypothetical protein ACRERD_32730 [Candidatus Binatia bacterium]